MVHVTLIDDGTLDTVVRVACDRCGGAYEERFGEWALRCGLDGAIAPDSWGEIVEECADAHAVDSPRCFEPLPGLVPAGYGTELVAGGQTETFLVFQELDQDTLLASYWAYDPDEPAGTLCPCSPPTISARRS